MKRAIKASNDGSNSIGALKTRIRLLKTIFDAMDELDATCFEDLELSDAYQRIGDAIRENTYELKGM